MAAGRGLDVSRWYWTHGGGRCRGCCWWWWWEVVPVHAADCKNIITKAKKKNIPWICVSRPAVWCWSFLFTIYKSELCVMRKNPETTAHVLRRNCWVNSVHCFMIITVWHCSNLNSFLPDFFFGELFYLWWLKLDFASLELWTRLSVVRGLDFASTPSILIT